jgi:hypothetical protein
VSGDAVRVGAIAIVGAIGGDCIRFGGLDWLVAFVVLAPPSSRSPNPEVERPPGGGVRNGKLVDVLAAFGGGSS